MTPEPTPTLKSQEDNDLQKIAELFRRNYKLFIVCVAVALLLAFAVNHYMIPVYKVSSSILIKENKNQPRGSEVNDYLNSSLFGMNQNFQNELWVMKSSPVLDQTVRNLDMSVAYYKRERFQYRDAYQDAPFRVYFSTGHPQPVNVRFELTFLAQGYFRLKAVSGETTFYNFENGQVTGKKDGWKFFKNGRLGELVETEDLAFIIRSDSTE